MNDDNLIPMNKRTKSEQREISQNAGKKSGEARREKRKLRQALEMLLEKEDYIIKDRQGGTKTANGYEYLAASMFREASKGSVQAFKEIRDTIGEKPTDIVEFESNNITGIKIKFVDKSNPKNRAEKDPKIIGDYTPPLNTEE